MVKEVKKAVFPVAGFGTRFLPATKAMPKELLPIVDKPLIQYAVEEAIEAGIETLIFVTGRNKTAIEDHFDYRPELERVLEDQGKHEQLQMVRDIIPDNINCIFVRQPKPRGLGDAVYCARSAVGEEPFAVILADDFCSLQISNPTTDLINAYCLLQKNQISVMEVNGPEISNYGVIVPGKIKEKVQGLIEKPDFNSAPSNLASIGRYVLDPEIFNVLSSLSPGKGGEIQLADAINELAKKDRIDAIQLRSKRFDCGTIDGFIEAINFEYNYRKKAVFIELI
jgi:UTP--glucose-1-phosphate uridylyltransferase